MDPNETLKRLQQLHAQYEIVGGEARRDAWKVEHMPEFLELFAALDEWISKGGFLPDAWRETPPRLKDNYGHAIRPV